MKSIRRINTHRTPDCARTHQLKIKRDKSMVYKPAKFACAQNSYSDGSYFMAIGKICVCLRPERIFTYTHTVRICVLTKFPHTACAICLQNKHMRASAHMAPHFAVRLICRRKRASETQSSWRSVGYFIPFQWIRHTAQICDTKTPRALRL